MRDMSYLTVLFVALFCLTVSLPTQAAGGGGMGSGGGTSCGATIRSGAEQVALWMDKNGPGMKNGCAMTGEEFRKLIPIESNFKYLSLEQELPYRNNPKATMFLEPDLKTIKVRCDRVDEAFGKNPVGFNKNVAHEIFRKTTKEGDEFECSKQVFSPREVAADIDYALEKKTTIMRFEDDPNVLVKISVSKNNVEFFGFRECQADAISETTQNNQTRVEIAFEKCSVIGANFYRAHDLSALEDAMNEKVLSQIGKQNPEAKATLAAGLGLFTNGALIYASDATEVAGLKQMGKAYDWIFTRLFQVKTYKQMMQTKGVVSVLSIALGTTLAYRAITLQERASEKVDRDLKNQNIQLRTGSGYATFGLYLLLNFQGDQLSTKRLKTIIVDTIQQLQDEKLIQSAGKI